MAAGVGVQHLPPFDGQEKGVELLKVLALTRYARLGASSRVRFLQYLPTLEAAGVQVEVLPLFGDVYVQGIQESARPAGQVLRAYGQRVLAARRAADADVLWLEKEAFPWLPAPFELSLIGDSVPMLLDYDDAVFHQYDEHPYEWVRHLLGGKHPALMRRAACVVAGNEYLAEFARDAGARQVEIIPTVVDLQRYVVRVPAAPLPQVPANVGWIGQRSTASFLRPLASVFEAMAREGVARFTAIGINAEHLGLPMASVPWSEMTEARDVCGLDIGIMPLGDAAFERGKCGYKLIQYMACGVPVVASPVGVNRQIVEHGVNGFLAESLEQWAMALRTLCTDPELRMRMGAAGRRKVEKHYSLQAMAPRLVQLLRTAAAGSPPSGAEA